jgi:hypothetical protein
MLVPLEPLMEVALDPVVEVPDEPITGVLGATGALLGSVPPMAPGRLVRRKGAGCGIANGSEGCISGRATSLSCGRLLLARHCLMKRLLCLPA